MSDTVPDMDDARRKLAADYAGLVTLIRTELQIALEPVREDIRDLKNNGYSREVMDEKLDSHNRRIQALEQGWATLMTRIAAAAALIWTLLSIVRSVHF